MKKAVIIIVCLIVLAAAGVVLASKFGLINYQSVISQIPIVNKFVATPSGGSAPEPYATLQQENASLKQQVQSMTEDLVASKGAESNSEAAGGGGAGSVSSTENNPADYLAQLQVYKDLANYYANMQPSSAVAILNNQDPQMVAAILYEMGKNQASDILAAMDSTQAAKLLQLMANIDGQVKGSNTSGNTSDIATGE